MQVNNQTVHVALCDEVFGVEFVGPRVVRVWRSRRGCDVNVRTSKLRQEIVRAARDMIERDPREY